MPTYIDWDEVIHRIVPYAVMLLQLLVATLCGGIIGYQREVVERPAGFRTHVLVCVGSAIYMLVSVAVAGTAWDPGRIAAQVASGIGFLGAGTIIKQGSIVRGLTTAASLWAVAAIGMAAGYNMQTMAIALLGTAVVYFGLTVLRPIEVRIARGIPFTMNLTLVAPRQRLSWIRQVLTTHKLAAHDLIFNDEKGEEEGDIIVNGNAPSQEDLDKAVETLTLDHHVRAVSWHAKD
ncbi:MAG: MgtC/SapB family protein [bacterium]